VGSGTGHFLREFARSGARCVGIEPSEEMLSVARASPMEGVQYLRGEGEHMPLADGIFDCVAYITTLEWVADVEACVSEAVRICVPGGRLVFLVLNARGPWYRQRVAEGGLWAEARFFDEATLRQLLSPYGTVTVEYAVHVPPSWARLPPVVIGVGDAAFRRLDRSDGALLGVRVDLRR
jgi:ubiquinone/menaquinone biosynthesis C-methylase UbiE